MTYIQDKQIKTNQAFNKEDWSSAYKNVETELTNESLKITKGENIVELNGTLLRNGPGILERGGQWVHHPFDGDGMITAINFKNGKPSLTNKFVRTKGYIEETKINKFVYRGVFGTQKSGGILNNALDLKFKNIANTHVVKLGNEVLALWEAAGPHALEPSNLDTKGLTTLNGVLKANEAFSAHPKADFNSNYSSEVMVTFGVQTGPKSTIRLMEFSNAGENSGELIFDRKDTFNGFAFLHDFAITTNWAIFLQNAIDFNPLPFVMGQKGAAQCLKSNPNKKAKFFIIPRESGLFKGQPSITIDAPEGFVFHHVNAFEKDSNIILDSIFYDDFPSVGPDENFRDIDFDQYPAGNLKRSIIDLKGKKSQFETLSTQTCEFATVNPKFLGLKATHSWMACTDKKTGNAPLQAIKKINLTTKEEIYWSAAPSGFVSEPIMVPSQISNKEDDGYLFVLIWNGSRRGSDLVILDANDLKELAIYELPISIPHGLHGSWVNN
ncbi:Retinal pigment epithelial membrane protein [Prochlorococcus marinus str. MIT 9515]|uniref:Retinal pigment epithelial membrane protein n=1 Tax=Prochlorococcus marinus (strain MIT 9515) TaxID=167542 RepID=A2BUR1_PROM5|nr:carotenoid oxygenase family protein [Prochlorococcus marinus]ABM71522.1 Retinal pigment epithelial membrane protein [Prochlorococcus marinus str. MIT 9515]